MNSVLSRLNTIFAFSVTVLASLTFGCFLSTFMNTNDAKVHIEIDRVLVRKASDWSMGHEVNDLGYVTWDMKADLDGLFNWNVKQLFLYLTAEYTTKDNKINQVVLWDEIIKRGENAKLTYRNMNPKYYFWDDGHGLRGNDNVTLILSWNVVPNAGQLLNRQGTGSRRFAMPNHYITSRD